MLKRAGNSQRRRLTTSSQLSPRRSTGDPYTAEVMSVLAKSSPWRAILSAIPKANQSRSGAQTEIT